MEKRVVDGTVIRRVAERATKHSAALERGGVPDEYVRSKATKRYFTKITKQA